MDSEMRAKVSALLEAVVTADGVIRAEEREFVRRLLVPYLRGGRPPRAPVAFRLFNWFPFLRWLPARFIGVGVRPEHVEALSTNSPG